MAKGEGEVAEGLLRELCDFARRVGDKPAYTLNGKQIADIIITAEQLAKHLAQLQSALRAAREDAARYRDARQLRHIIDIHEDFGNVVLWNWNGEDLNDYEIGSCLDTGFDESRWTHFSILVEPDFDAARRAEHVHEWLDARNNVITSGEFCKCGAIREGNDSTDAGRTPTFADERAALHALADAIDNARRADGGR